MNKKLRENIAEQIRKSLNYDEEEDEASWGYQKGILLTRKEAKKCLKALEGQKQ